MVHSPQTYASPQAKTSEIVRKKANGSAVRLFLCEGEQEKLLLIFKVFGVRFTAVLAYFRLGGVGVKIILAVYAHKVH